MQTHSIMCDSESLNEKMKKVSTFRVRSKRHSFVNVQTGDDCCCVLQNFCSGESLFLIVLSLLKTAKNTHAYYKPGAVA